MAVLVRNKIDEIPSEKELEVELRLLTLEDRTAVRRWLSDPYILHLTFVVPGPSFSPSMPFSASAADQYLNTLVYDKSRFTFAIEVNGNHVGNIGLKEYNLERKTSELFIEIGEGDYRGKGVGKVAMAILMDHAFFSMDLVEIRLEVLEFNDVAIRVYQQLGFIKTHRSGWHYDANGQYWQVWAMKLSNERWRAIRKNLVIPRNLIATPLTKI